MEETRLLGPDLPAQQVFGASPEDTRWDPGSRDVDFLTADIQSGSKRIDHRQTHPQLVSPGWDWFADGLFRAADATAKQTMRATKAHAAPARMMTVTMPIIRSFA